jgi:hypothetical protein
MRLLTQQGNNKQNNLVGLYMSLELERLTNEYDAVLVQYKKAKADLSGTVSASETTRKLVKGQQVMGGQALGETDAQSAEDCSALCASDEKCTGATFKYSTKKCATYSGAELDATPSDNTDDYAIYNANTKLAKTLNAKLKDLGRQIKELSKDKPDSSETVAQLDSAEQELSLEDSLLDVELQKHDDMASAIQETTIQTTMNQYWYWILLAGIVLLIGTLIYIFSSSSKPSGVSPSAPNRYSSSSSSSSWTRPSSSSSTSDSSWYPGSRSSSSSDSSWYPGSRSSSSSDSSWYPNSSSNSDFSRNMNRMFGGFLKGGALKPGKLKYSALIPGVVMLAATLVATQLQKVIF